jgi:hypothetical protein
MNVPAAAIWISGPLDNRTLSVAAGEKWARSSEWVSMPFLK